MSTKPMNPDDYLKKPYARRLVPDESGGFCASIQEFPGCLAEGETADEALQNLEAAAASWVEVALSLGQSIPEPTAFHGYSGKIALRIPRGLHKQAAELAEIEETSLNQFLINAIAQYMGQKNGLEHAYQKIAVELRKLSIVTSHSSPHLFIEPAEAKRMTTPTSGVLQLSKKQNFGEGVSNYPRTRTGIVKR